MVGVLFFFKNGNVEPAEAFRLNMSIETIVMVMLGGQGTVLGPVIGAAGYQRLRGFLLTSPIFKNIQLSVAGALLLLIILFIPGEVQSGGCETVSPSCGGSCHDSASSRVLPSGSADCRR